MKIALLMFAILASGCATTAPQTAKILEKAPEGLDRQALVSNVPYIKQTDNYCGPATLAMAMTWAGTPTQMESVAKETFTPGMKGTLQQDMISDARRHGLMAVEIEGEESLLREIAAGHPVIVFENLAFTWYPNWHYALAFGYDLQKQEIVLHSGSQPDRHWDLAKFERSWRYSDYWGLVVLPPGQLAVAGDEVAHLQSAAGLEQIGKIEEAKVSYESILKKWPQSLGALVGASNIAYKQGKFDDTLKFLSLASLYHPDSKAVAHNLAVVRRAMDHRSAN